MGSKQKNYLTKTFMKLGNMPESTNSDKNIMEFLLKQSTDIENNSINEIESVNSQNLLQMI